MGLQTADLTRAAAVALAIVFALAAIAKLRSQQSTALGFAELHLPMPSLTARLVPAVELATAALLLVRPLWGGFVAFALLVGFTAFLADLVRRGVRVPCRCFGAVSAAPTSRAALRRNAVLLVLTLAVVLLS